MPQPSKFSIGWIPYWNLFPLRKEIVKHWGHQLQLVMGHPTLINRHVGEGRLGVAPCSSICLLTNPGQEMALPLGIASSGSVQSVYIGLKGVKDEEDELLARLAARESVLAEVFKQAHQRYGDDMRSIGAFVWDQAHSLPSCYARLSHRPPSLRLSQSSAASNAMVRVLFHLWFGEDAARALLVGKEAGSGDEGRMTLELLIGDEALIRRPHFTHLIDLGECWWRLTGLPFVFAVWQKSALASMAPAVFALWRQRIWEASEIAQARMRVEPHDYLPEPMPVDEAGRDLDLVSYWRSLEYRLGMHHFKGLLLYLNLARLVMTGIEDEKAVVKILRWQEWASDRGMA